MNFLDIHKQMAFLERERDRNINLHCPRVADRYQREIDKLKKELEKTKK